MALYLGKNLLCITSFATGRAFELAHENLFQPPPHDGMVIGDKDPDHLSSFGGVGWVSGIRTLTVVPAPRVPAMVTSPPSSRARSRIPRIPSELPAVSCSSLTPPPLS